MPIDPAMLATSIATLADLDPELDLAATLEQAVVAAKQLFEVDGAGIMLADADGRLRWASASDPLAQALEDNQETFAAGPCLEAFTTGRPAVIGDATLEPRWGEITLAFVELQIRSGLSVPVQLGGGPIGTLDVYAAAPGGGMRPRSAPCRPMPGWSRPCSGRPPRPSGAAGWPSNSRSPLTSES
jgi:GAF domain-containing protein